MASQLQSVYQWYFSGFAQKLTCLLVIIMANIAAVSASAQTLASEDSFYNVVNPDVLINQDGKQLTLNDFLGKTVLVNFVFVDCASVCLTQTQSLKRLQNSLPSAMKKQYYQLSISIDAKKHNPTALKAFADKQGVKLASWQFATADFIDTAKMMERLAAYGDAKMQRHSTGRDHQTALWLIGPDGKLAARYPGYPVKTGQLIKAITTLQAAI